jgi:1,4-dihydroxy-2-naphthoate polyprenyltransferase
MVNFAMWGKALRVIPRISKAEWDQLDLVSRWLIATRAAVFIMTAMAAGIGGLLAWRYGNFSWSLFLMTLFGLVLAHATNNLLNDLVDFQKGIDHNNYYRSLYGPQPLEHGLLSRPQFMTYLWVTGLIALGLGVFLTWNTGFPALWFLLAGLFFLLFYTWPLKYFGLGEPSVILVWGPLMVGGTFLVVTGGAWSNSVAYLSLVYALGPTTVLFGKHTDKILEDKAKGIKTLPVLLGQKTARWITIFFWITQYLLVIGLVLTRELGPALLIVLLALPKFFQAYKRFSKPRPEKEPEDLEKNVWPLYLVSQAFDYNKRFGLLFLLGLIIDVVLYKTGVVF